MQMNYQGNYYYFAYSIGVDNWVVLPAPFYVNSFPNNTIFGQFVSTNYFGLEIKQHMYSETFHLVVLKSPDNFYRSHETLEQFVNLLNETHIEKISELECVVLKQELAGEKIKHIYDTLNASIQKTNYPYYKKQLLASDNDECAIGVNFTVARNKETQKVHQIMNLPFFRV